MPIVQLLLRLYKWPMGAFRIREARVVVLGTTRIWAAYGNLHYSVD